MSKKVHIEWATVSHSHSDETLMNHMLSFSHKILNAKTFVYKKMMGNSIQHTTQHQKITYRAGYRESCSTISLYLTTVMHSPPLRNSLALVCLYDLWTYYLGQDIEASII